MFLDVFETWGFRDFNDDSPVHVNEMMQDQKPVILPHGFLYTCTRVSALRGDRLCLSNDLVGHLEDGSWIGSKWRADFRELQGPEKRIVNVFFFLVGAEKNAPKSGEIEPVLEDRSGTDFLPETGCFFRYRRYFDGTLGVGCLCPMFFRWQAQLVWCIGSVHWKHLVFPTFSQ